jgi:hypothetical protein
MKISQRQAWKLFIDDNREPVDSSFVVARTVPEAQKMIEERGCPSFISFDHDLEPEPAPNGFGLAKWLVDMDLDGKIDIPADFSFYVHSQNPQGKANIEGLLNQYLRHKRNSQ